MDWFVPKFRRDPNKKVDSIYSGIAPNGRTVTSIRSPSSDGNRMETTTTYGPGLQRGQGGRVAVLVLGGMETTLDEMQYILEAKQQKAFTPKRTSGQIVEMCRMLIERRNDRVRHLRKNPSERPKKRIRLHLPVGYRYVNTVVPGMRVLARL